jgi:uncharacterized membrane protein
MSADAPRLSSTGLPVHIAAALAYVFGFISGVFLLVIEKDSADVRFHAAQSSIVFIGATVVNFLLIALPLVGWLLVPVFVLGMVGLWVLLIVKALSGVRYKLPWVGDFAEDISR